MFTRFSWQPQYGALFYTVTLAAALFCAVEPMVVGSLAAADEASGIQGLSMFRVVVRPVVYLVGLTLFLLFDQSYSQFIYSQF
jgi:hypothetical protein